MTSKLPRLFLSGFRRHATRYSCSQTEALLWLARAHAKSAASSGKPEISESTLHRLLTRFGCGPDRIARRGYELEDFSHTDWGRMRLFNLEESPAGARIEARNRFYDDVAYRAVNALLPEGGAAPDAAVHVSCTGYTSPSALQRVVSDRGWGGKTQIQHAYHMGCYASHPAIRAAGGLLLGLSPDARASVIHTELCTLHLRPDQGAPENLVIQSLFADGHIAYDVSFAGGAPAREAGLGFEVLSIADCQVPGTSEDMRWWLTDFSMGMALSREVPVRIAQALPSAIESLCGMAGTSIERIRREAVWAIHPGGPKIIDQIAAHFDLSESQISASRKVLLENGNMSSATLPHVWQEILENPAIPQGTPVVSLAFGPGLTIAGSVLVKARSAG